MTLYISHPSCDGQHCTCVAQASLAHLSFQALRIQESVQVTEKHLLQDSEDKDVLAIGAQLHKGSQDATTASKAIKMLPVLKSLVNTELKTVSRHSTPLVPSAREHSERSRGKSKNRRYE